MIKILFEGHAQTHDNVAGVASGHRDVALTELGREHARGVQRTEYAGMHFDVIFTSDTQRAYETATLIFEGTVTPIVKDSRLRECDYGDFEGRSRADMEKARAKAITAPFPNGESYEQVAERMRSFLNDLAAHHDGERVMVIGHQATF